MTWSGGGGDLRCLTDDHWEERCPAREGMLVVAATRELCPGHRAGVLSKVTEQFLLLPLLSVTSPRGPRSPVNVSVRDTLEWRPS